MVHFSDLETFSKSEVWLKSVDGKVFGGRWPNSGPKFLKKKKSKYLNHVFNDPKTQKGEHPIWVKGGFYPLPGGPMFCIHLSFDWTFLFRKKF